jgi:hypothetical protein
MPRSRILLFCFAALPVGCSKSAAGPVNAEYARIYETVCNQYLKGEQPQPDAAITALEDLRKKEGSNAMTSYLLATAYAAKQDWDRVSKELHAGNEVTRCAQYVNEGLAAYWTFPAYARLRDLARSCAAAAPGMGPEKGTALLKEVRVMAKRVAAGEPPTVIGVLVGMALNAIADRGLEETYAKAGRTAEAEQARRRSAAFKDWGTAMRKEFEANARTTDFAAMMSRTGMSRKEAAQLEQDPNPKTEALKRKVQVMNRELAAAEKPMIDKALKTWPADK